MKKVTMKRLMLTEEEKNYIKGLYYLNEQETSSGIADIIIKATKKELERKDSDSEDYDTLSTSDEMEDSTMFDTSSGEFYVHPNADSLTINYGPKAQKLNSSAELLLKSIFAKAGTPNLKVTSTLRTYDDQARVNKQNSRNDILKWYGEDVVKVWDKYVAGEMTQEQYADFLKKRDKRVGKVMSNHIPGFAIDVVPYNEKFASTADVLMRDPNSGIRKVLREKDNNAVHIEFNFPVTTKGGVGSVPKIPTMKKGKKSDTLISQDGIIVDKNNNSSNYAIVFGGSPSSNYGAQFMFEKGSKILSNKNVVYSNFENSLESVINKVKSMDSDAKITSVSGFSAGGKNAWEAATKGYKVGLIDPVVPDFASKLVGSDFDGELPSNIKMISRQENWSGQFRKHGERLKNLESSQPDVRRNVSHKDMPSQFFTDFKNFV